MDMQTALVGVVIIIIVCLVGAVIETVFKAWRKRREQRLARIAEDNKIREKLAQELAEWQQKVAAASHLLTGRNWRDPAGKTEFVEQLYEGVPEYLWFALGDGVYEEQALDNAVDLLWGKEDRPAPGDLQLHQSGNKEVGLALQVRFPKNFVAELRLGDKVCPLYRTFYNYQGGRHTGYADFVDLYELIKACQPTPTE